MDKEIKWTNLSLKEISKALESKSMNIAPHVVKQLLKKHGFVERKMQKAVTMKERLFIIFWSCIDCSQLLVKLMVNFGNPRRY